MGTTLTLNLNDFKKAKKFIEIANKFNSDIDVIRNHYIIDAKSILGIFTIDLSIPVEIRINSDDKAEIARFNEFMEEFIDK